MAQIQEDLIDVGGGEDVCADPLHLFGVSGFESGIAYTRQRSFGLHQRISKRDERGILGKVGNAVSAWNPSPLTCFGRCCFRVSQCIPTRSQGKQKAFS